ncbi:hypothetical protein B0T10DRAFT_105135 [Thelonectria olida]|uniref:Transmembrane protein 14C n=1 Tax=Thelonectria olida TaxID=1576542 RepID=A0A9P9AVL5_9HYPO|nr:hypothetical protein B0T10DRAFT_105135 [Thelonectria olida]
MRAHDPCPPSSPAVLLVSCVCTSTSTSKQQALIIALDTLGGYRIQNRQPYGIELCLLASVVLAGSAFPRAIRLRKPVPIVLSIISSIGLYTFGTAMRK